MTSSSSSSPFTTILILFLSCLTLCLSVIAAEHPTDRTICTPFGPCQPCPDDALNQPFCKPFGNRRLMHCTNASSNAPSSPHSPPGGGPPNQRIQMPQHPPHSGGEDLAWESCGRIVIRERRDFWEFIGCNILFAGIAIAIVVVRTKRGNMQKARALAARIGIGGSTAYAGRGRSH